MERPERAAGGPEPAGADRPAPTARPRRRPAGVSVIVGGLLQDLQDRMQRNLAPIEERVRPGEETRGLAGAAGDDPPRRADGGSSPACTRQKRD